MTKEDVVDKLRAMVGNMTGRGEAEAKTLMSRAQALAAKYALDLNAVTMEDSDEREQAMRSSDVSVGGVRQKAYRWQLAWVVSEIHGCVPWTQHKYDVKLRAPLTEDQASAVVSRMTNFISRIAATRVSDDTTAVEMVGNDTIRVRAMFTGMSVGYVSAVVEASLGERSYLQNFHADDAEYVEGVTVRQCLVMVGPKGLAEAAIYVYSVLVREVDEIAKRINDIRRKNNKDGSSDLPYGRRVINSSRVGLVSGLRERLAKNRTEALDGDGVERETALSVIDMAKESGRHLSDAYGGKAFSGTSGPTVLDYDAYRSGHARAAAIDIPDSHADKDRLLRNSRLAIGPAKD